VVNIARTKRGSARILVLACLSLAAPASASVDVSYSISNTFGVLLGSNAGAEANLAGLSKQYYAASSDPNARSELGVNYTAYADSGGFYFLHQDYCTGNCSVYSSTVISIALTNTDSSPVNLRFDSMITPGHLALTHPTQLTSGSYSFEVIQNSGAEAELFRTTGRITSDGVSVDQGQIDSDAFAFNGLSETQTGDFHTIDWGATNLSVPLLTIAGNSSSLLSYVAIYQVTNDDGQCLDLATCSSLEVAFGDPRNDGSIIAERAAFLSFGTKPLDKAVVGGGYDPFFIPFSFVPVGSPDPDAPPNPPLINYTTAFRSNVIDDGQDPSAAPEPATWATMVLGFGVAGLAVRRRHGSRRAAL